MSNDHIHKSNGHNMPSETVTFVGCSGYTNIGDDMYPLVLKKYFKDYDLLFKNSDLPRKLPKECKLLVMGPGGIIYQNHTDHSNYMVEYMEQAFENKIPLVFLGCGVQKSEIPHWKKYLDYAELITVRSQKDVEYIKAYTNNPNIFYFPDIGYLFDEYEDVPNLPDTYSVFIPTGIAKETHNLLSHYLQTPKEQRILLRTGATQDIEKNYPSWLAYGEAKTIVDVNPAMVNYIIKHASMVYTGRYHGIVFSRKNQVPYVVGGLNPSPLKLQNEDLKSNYLDAIFHLKKFEIIVKKYVNVKNNETLSIIDTLKRLLRF